MTSRDVSQAETVGKSVGQAVCQLDTVCNQSPQVYELMKEGHHRPALRIMDDMIKRAEMATEALRVARSRMVA